MDGKDRARALFALQAVSFRPAEASFRDPSGFLFFRDGVLYRQINWSYRRHHERLLESGLYDALVGDGLLISHRDAAADLALTAEAYRVIRPEPVGFVSYPYEWCFSQLRDAALTTLRIQRQALAHGMILKDASAYNIQYDEGRPVHIDTLSFEEYQKDTPWVAYRQFCEHFLGPLLLMSQVDIHLGRLLATYLDGVPLALASRLLPRRTWLRFSRLLHIHLHAWLVKRYGRRSIRGSHLDRSVSRRSLDGLVGSLETAVDGLDWRPTGTHWADYPSEHGYSDEALAEKKRLTERMLGRIEPKVVWDLGSNVGVYSRLAASMGAKVIAIDSDPAATELNYREVKRRDERSILPLLVDLRNPSPGLGWAGRERSSLESRGPAQVVLALALVHHLAIGGNVPLPRIADWLARVARHLIIEFVPKADPQTQRLLTSRQDVFAKYTQPEFEREFERRFRVVATEPITGTQRTLYWMTTRECERDA